jgi:hypothetical protein
LKTKHLTTTASAGGSEAGTLNETAALSPRAYQLVTIRQYFADHNRESRRGKTLESVGMPAVFLDCRQPPNGFFLAEHKYLLIFPKPPQASYYISLRIIS